MGLLFNINILTRDRAVYDGKIQSLTAPGGLGYLGILANHAPLVTDLVPGNLILKTDTGKTIVMRSTGKGFLEVLDNTATLLVDSVEDAPK